MRVQPKKPKRGGKKVPSEKKKNFSQKKKKKYRLVFDIENKQKKEEAGVKNCQTKTRCAEPGERYFPVANGAFLFASYFPMHIKSASRKKKKRERKEKKKIKKAMSCESFFF